jgi:hypothetical protein
MQHWILTIDRSFLAFIYFENGTFPLGFYGDLSQLTETVKTGFLMAASAVGDALIVGSSRSLPSIANPSRLVPDSSSMDRVGPQQVRYYIPVVHIGGAQW